MHAPGGGALGPLFSVTLLWLPVDDVLVAGPHPGGGQSAVRDVAAFIDWQSGGT